MLTAALLISSFTAPYKAALAESRDLGEILGWKVRCAIRDDSNAIKSCGATLIHGNIQILVGTDKTRTYTVSKGCGHPHAYWLGTGSIDAERDISLLRMAVSKAAEFDGYRLQSKCEKQSTPPNQVFGDLRTLMMLMRTFPASPEDKGIWYH